MTDEEAREAARQEWASDDLEIDDDAIMSRTNAGVWVGAWVFVADPNAPEDDDDIVSTPGDDVPLKAK